ncbi:MAG: hypothetical protein OEL20_04645 [Sulfuritalea sp.]|nr:hypothetical protein [Sulfuritalea sp.]
MNTTPRSASILVRNPLMALPAAKALDQLPIEAKVALRALLREISADARVRAEKCWRSHKGPMALYWKCLAVYSNHASRLLKP